MNENNQQGNNVKREVGMGELPSFKKVFRTGSRLADFTTFSTGENFSKAACSSFKVSSEGDSAKEPLKNKLLIALETSSRNFLSSRTLIGALASSHLAHSLGFVSNFFVVAITPLL